MNEEKRQNLANGTETGDQPDDGGQHPVSEDHSEGTSTDETLPLEDLSKPELIQKIQQLQEDVKAHYDLFLRAQADMENLKKRQQKEKEDWRRFATEKLIKDLLPAVDNLQSAIAHTHDENSADSLREGLELTLKGLRGALETAGLEEVRAEGEPFDPCFHEAISMQEDENLQAGHVLKELQKGYTLNERLLRPALVVVSKGKSGEDQGHPSDETCES
jgi:molecular chaperone GrpE